MLRFSALCIGAFVATVAQLVRAPVCGTGGRGFETPRSPHAPHLPLAQVTAKAGTVTYEALDQWQFILAAYGLGVGATLALVVWSWMTMRRAERRRDRSRDK